MAAETLDSTVLDALPEATLVVAFSGGLDSTVLLDLVATSSRRSRARVLHVNHQMQGCADDWQRHCEQVCEAYGLPLEVVQVELKPAGRGVEAAAREARYQAYSKSLDETHILLLAHHADDQAETLLYRLMRRSGVDGLAGMPVDRRHEHFHLYRPLLQVPRSVLLAYAKARNLVWVEDTSNQSEEYDRNFLRHRVMPVLNERWPEASVQLAGSSTLLAEASTLLAEYAREDLESLNRRSERAGESIAIEGLRRFPLARRQHLLRFWCQSYGAPSPRAKQWPAIVALIEGAIEGDAKQILGEFALRRYQGRLYLTPELETSDLDDGILWDGVGVLTLGTAGKLEFTSAVIGRQFCVRFRRGGERAKPIDRKHSQTLKKLLLEYGLEPWWRDRIPLLYEGDEIVAVGDLFRCEESLPALRWSLFEH